MNRARKGGLAAVCCLAALRRLAALGILTGAALLAACGQMGPLTLPEAADNGSAATATTTDDNDEDGANER